MTLRKLAKLVAAPLAVLALTGAHYHGDRVYINFPDGWEAPKTEAEGLVTIHEGATGANCNIQTKDLDSLADSTLAEINLNYSHAFDIAEWADFLAIEASDITIIKGEVRPFADAYFHIATLRIKIDKSTDAMVRYGFYVLPGRVTMAGCYVKADQFPSYSALFDTTISSLRPW